MAINEITEEIKENLRMEVRDEVREIDSQKAQAMK